MTPFHQCSLSRCLMTLHLCEAYNQAQVETCPSTLTSAWHGRPLHKCPLGAELTLRPWLGANPHPLLLPEGGAFGACTLATSLPAHFTSAFPELSV